MAAEIEIGDVEDLQAGFIEARLVDGGEILDAFGAEHAIAGGVEKETTVRVGIEVELETAHSGVELGFEVGMTIA